MGRSSLCKGQASRAGGQKRLMRLLTPISSQARSCAMVGAIAGTRNQARANVSRTERGGSGRVKLHVVQAKDSWVSMPSSRMSLLLPSATSRSPTIPMTPLPAAPGSRATPEAPSRAPVPPRRLPRRGDARYLAEACRKRQELGFIKPGCRRYGDDAWLALGERLRQPSRSCGALPWRNSPGKGFSSTALGTAPYVAAIIGSPG